MFSIRIRIIALNYNITVFVLNDNENVINVNNCIGLGQLFLFRIYYRTKLQLYNDS